MEKPITLSRSKNDHPGFHFDALFREGIRTAQTHSGRIWTDYNYHDPGVTILEYLVYALMDLAYRTNMPVEDLFFFGADDHDPVRENLLIPPEDIFPINPYTSFDYRRLIIDRVRGVKNVWVNPVQDESGSYKGLLEILVQSRDDLQPADRQQLSDEITELFLRHRNLGCDIGRITLLEAVPLSVSGTVLIDVDAIGEFVLSRIFAELDAYVNPEVAFSNPYDLIRDGMPPDEVFSGPKPLHGLIRKEELRPKSDSVYVSRMRDIIGRIPGVKSVVELQVFRKGLPVRGDQIAFSSGDYPVIEFRNLMEPDGIGIRLIKNSLQVEVDPLTTQQLLDFETASRRSQYLGRIQYRNQLPKGRFRPEEILRHYSIHNEFPAIYGLGEYSQVQQTASGERRAQSKQLRAYLAFFEQIVANHLAQLANMRKLLSIGEDNTTYHTQLPTDIPFFDELLFEDRAALEARLRELANDGSHSHSRRNRILDHLMARFSERFEAEILRKNALQDTSVSRDDVEADIISAKIRFLRHITELGTQRNRAFDYRSSETWDTRNVSTLEKKIALLLDIRTQGRRSLSKSLMDAMAMTVAEGGEDLEWMEDTLPSSGPEAPITIIRPASGALGASEVRFPRQGVDFIPYLFSNISNPRTVRVVTTRREGRTRHHLLMRMPVRATDALLYENADLTECLVQLDRLRQRISAIDRDSEGFHMVEHILLRPLEPVLFTFNILDDKGNIYITGYFPGSMEAQNLVAQEIPLIGSREETFGIIADEGETRFEVLLHDSSHQPVARLAEDFPSRARAQRAISDAVAYLARILAREIPLAQVLEVTASANQRLDMPADFPFSNTVSFILPDWPVRFQNDEFQALFRRLVLENLPAHFDARIHWLDPVSLAAFEDLYQRWLAAKAKPQSNLRDVDMLSLGMIQTLAGLRAHPSAT
jgi:hypothetical protein